MNNEQLTEHLFQITEKLGLLDLIHAEVKRTNGRVTKLEDLSANLAKLVSQHSGKFEQMVAEHRATIELIKAKEDSFRGVIGEWEARRDAKYEEEKQSRNEWMDRLWLLLKFLIPLGVAATLAVLGIEALPVVPGL